MVVSGIVRNGVVVLKSKKSLPDGARVTVKHVSTKNSNKCAKRRPAERQADHPLKGLMKILKKYSGSVKGLPSDLADNHDYYLHGLPKRKP